MRTFTPRDAAINRSIISRSVRYAFITSRRSRAPSICSRSVGGGNEAAGIT